MKDAMPSTNTNPAVKIDFFGGEYAFLCNFYERPVEFEGLAYGSSEAAFAAQKTANMVERRRFCSLTPSAAKSYGRSISLRPGWDGMKYQVMLAVIRAKFQQHPDLALKLLNTGTAYLEEGNYWGDRIWGTVDGVGTNWLGRILMQVRKELEQHAKLEVRTER